MGNEGRRRIASWVEEAIWEHHYWTPNSARRAIRYAKHVVGRRERREGRHMARKGDLEL